MERVEEFIVDYIQREYTVPDGIDIKKVNYVDEGYIDSLGLIQFISIIEDEFDIAFTDKELASQGIKTVGGLIDLIVTKMEGAK